MQHARGFSFPPVFPSVCFYDPLIDLAILVGMVPSGLPHTISVEASIKVHIVAGVQLVNLVVQPINFLPVVDIAWVWDRPIVRKPAQLRRV